MRFLQRLTDDACVQWGWGMVFMSGRGTSAWMGSSCSVFSATASWRVKGLGRDGRRGGNLAFQMSGGECRMYRWEAGRG